MHTQGNGRRSTVNVQSNLVCLILALVQKKEKTILQKNHRLLNKKTNAGSKKRKISGFMHTQSNGRRSIVNIQSNLVCLILALAQKQEKTVLQKNTIYEIKKQIRAAK